MQEKIDSGEISTDELQEMLESKMVTFMTISRFFSTQNWMSYGGNLFATRERFYYMFSQLER